MRTTDSNELFLGPDEPKITLTYASKERHVQVEVGNDAVPELLEAFADFLSACGYAKYRFDIVEDDE